jgi:hypothetical protein
MFAKKVQSIRSFYKNAESEQVAAAKLEEHNKASVLYAQVLQNNDYVGYVELDDNDKEDIFHFMTDKVLDNGRTKFDTALENPDTRVKVAWFLEKGPDFFKEVYDRLQQAEEIKQEHKTTKESSTATATESKTPESTLKERLATAFRTQGYATPPPQQAQPSASSVYSGHNNNNRSKITPFDLIQ